MIVKLIEEEGTGRPVDLVKRLGISPQAIHRHLKSLLSAGLLERRGRGPMTRYIIAGAVQLEQAGHWFASSGPPAESPEGLACATRDVFTARLSRLGPFARLGLKEEEVPF
jgi:DNA-binding transcriptional ArsR family regulator